MIEPIVGVYAIEHVASGKRYIGSSGNVALRWRQHRSRLDRGVHHCAHLQHAWQQYGREAFDLLVLEHVAVDDELLLREQAWFDSTPKALRYNTAPAAGTTRGMRMPPEAVARSRAARTGRIVSEITRQRLSEAHKRGNYPPMPRISDELRSAIAKRRRGFKFRPESIEQRSAKRRGIRQHPETIAKRVTPAWRDAIARGQRKGQSLPAFRAPDGTEWREIVNVAAFARAQGLTRSEGALLRRLWRGGLRSTKGWTAIRDTNGERAA